MPLISIFFWSLFHVFGERSKGNNYSWYHSYFHVPHFSQLSGKILVSVNLFAFFYFLLIVHWNGKTHKLTCSFFFKFFLVWSSLWRSVCISISLRNFFIAFSITCSCLCIYHESAWSNFNRFHNLLEISILTQSYLILSSFCESLLHSIIIIILLVWEFFLPALADGFPLETWVTTSLLKSPGLFSVFWPISVML